MRNAQTAPFARRVADSAMRAALHVWPEESRRWGRALQAELDEIESPVAVLRWAMGGFMVLGRAWWNHVVHSWRRPFGIPAEGPLASKVAEAKRLPRMPRFVTVLLLAASVALFFTRDFRQAFSAGTQAWGAGLPRVDYDSGNWLRAKANQTHDPELLAIYAITTWRSNDERLQAAAEAVRRDPSLVWIYSKVRLLDEPCCGLHPVSKEGVAALEKADPDNALPRLLAASLIYEKAERDWSSKPDPRGEFDYKRLVEQNPEWQAAMNYAFQAPKFDSYQAQAFELYRSAARRYDLADYPELGVRMLRNAGFGPGSSVGMYSDWLLTQGESAEKAGKLDQAADLYWEPVLFAQRVLQQDGSDTANWWLLNAERTSFQKLRPLLLKMGRKDEAEAMAYQQSSLQARFERGFGNNYYWDEYQGGWTGLMIRCLCAIVFLLGAAVVVGFGIFAFGRWRNPDSPQKVLGAGAAAMDYAPLLLLLASGALFVVFRPLILTYNRYMSVPWSSDTARGLEFSAAAPYGMPMWYYGFSAKYLNAYHGWMVLIIGLSVMAAYILAR